MVPYSSFMKLKKGQGPNEITRFNLYNSAAIQGLPAKGYTTAEAIQAMFLLTLDFEQSATFTTEAAAEMIREKGLVCQVWSGASTMGS